MEAVKAYDKAIQIDPNMEVAIFNRALIYAELGRDDEAAHARDLLLGRESPFGKQLQGLFALNCDANLVVGNKAVQARDWDPALAKYKVALIYDKNSSAAYIGRGLVWAHQNKFDVAIIEFDLAIKIDAKSAPAYHNRALANLERKEFQMAVHDFTKAIEIQPTTPSSFAGRARAYEGMNELTKANEDRNTAEKLAGQPK